MTGRLGTVGYRDWYCLKLNWLALVLIHASNYLILLSAWLHLSIRGCNTWWGEINLVTFSCGSSRIDVHFVIVMLYHARAYVPAFFTVVCKRRGALVNRLEYYCFCTKDSKWS
jgi:hypothetical protein